MQTGNEALLKGLVEAMKAELEGRNFYRMASQATTDLKGKEVFEQLAAEEMGHYEFLLAQYKAVLEHGAPDNAATLGNMTVLEGISPIFSADLKKRAKDAHFEMTALSIGIQLELSAVNFYQTQADAATRPDVKNFFSALVRWESGHYQTLLKQQEFLKEEYWGAAGFAPF